jgi:hypothetical protein
MSRHFSSMFLFLPPRFRWQVTDTTKMRFFSSLCSGEFAERQSHLFRMPHVTSAPHHLSAPTALNYT